MQTVRTIQMISADFSMLKSTEPFLSGWDSSEVSFAQTPFDFVSCYQHAFGVLDQLCENIEGFQ